MPRREGGGASSFLLVFPRRSSAKSLHFRNLIYPSGPGSFQNNCEKESWASTTVCACVCVHACTTSRCLAFQRSQSIFLDIYYILELRFISIMGALRLNEPWDLPKWPSWSWGVGERRWSPDPLAPNVKLSCSAHGGAHLSQLRAVSPEQCVEQTMRYV